MPVTPDRPVDGLVGVYHADGGLAGELRYAWGKVVRHQHCELCDLTHAGLRRRATWDAMVSRLGVPFELVHRNEQSEEVRRAGRGQTPAVLAQVAGSLRVLLPPEALQEAGRDVARFELTLRQALGNAGLTLP